LKGLIFIHNATFFVKDFKMKDEQTRSLIECQRAIF
jgi:hypothetical protein